MRGQPDPTLDWVAGGDNGELCVPCRPTSTLLGPPAWDLLAAFGRGAGAVATVPMHMSDYDAIVIGAGHNGLTAAAVMARGGMRVLCASRRTTSSGGWPRPPS